MLAKAAAEEEQRRAMEQKIAAETLDEERGKAEREKQLAQREAQLAREAREAQCQFKAVMSDADIARCRAAFSR
jgi:hypothetical protein